MLVRTFREKINNNKSTPAGILWRVYVAKINTRPFRTCNTFTVVHATKPWRRKTDFTRGRKPFTTSVYEHERVCCFRLRKSSDGRYGWWILAKSGVFHLPPPHNRRLGLSRHASHTTTCAAVATALIYFATFDMNIFSKRPCVRSKCSSDATVYRRFVTIC